MELTRAQQKRVRAHAKWLNQGQSKTIYNRTIEIARRYEPKGDPDRWLLFLANNIYINECSKPARR